MARVRGLIVSPFQVVERAPQGDQVRPSRGIGRYGGIGRHCGVDWRCGIGRRCGINRRRRIGRHCGINRRRGIGRRRGINRHRGIGWPPAAKKVADEGCGVSDLPVEKIEAGAVLDMPDAGLVPFGAQMDEALEIGHRQAGVEADLAGERGPLLLQPIDLRIGLAHPMRDPLRARRPGLLQGQRVQPCLDHLAQVLAHGLLVPLRRRREARFIETASGLFGRRRRRGLAGALRKRRKAEDDQHDEGQQGGEGTGERGQRVLDPGGHGGERGEGQGHPGDDPARASPTPAAGRNRRRSRPATPATPRRRCAGALPPLLRAPPRPGRAAPSTRAGALVRWSAGPRPPRHAGRRQRPAAAGRCRGWRLQGLREPWRPLWPRRCGSRRARWACHRAAPVHREPQRPVRPMRRGSCRAR